MARVLSFAGNPATAYQLQVTDDGQAATDATIRLNGTTVVSRGTLLGTPTQVTVPVTLQGSNTLEIQVRGSNQPRVTISVLGGVATTLTKVSGDGQTGVPGAPLPQPLVVRVDDILGHPVPGTTVAFGAISGGGSLVPSTVPTDAQGLAASTWTLGASGMDTASAVAAGLNGSPVTFSTLSVGFISGKVVDISTGNGIANALVRFRQFIGSPIQSVVAGADGSYTSPGLLPGNWLISVNTSQYINEFGPTVGVSSGAMTDAGQFTLCPIGSPNSVTVSGRLIDGANGLPLSGAYAELRFGHYLPIPQGLLLGGAAFMDPTDSQGNFAMSAQNSCYFLMGRTPGYLPSPLDPLGYLPPGTSKAVQDVALTPFPASAFTVAFTWTSPQPFTNFDMDGHGTGPDGLGGRFHVWFGNQGSSSAPPFTSQDWDDNGSTGLEQITVWQPVAGVYRFSLHNFTAKDSVNSVGLSLSGARVRVFQGSTMIQQFVVPNQAGNLWTVFEWDGTTITPVNLMSDVADPTTIQGTTGAMVTRSGQASLKGLVP